jgi:hypothetical protein
MSARMRTVEEQATLNPGGMLLPTVQIVRSTSPL